MLSVASVDPEAPVFACVAGLGLSRAVGRGPELPSSGFGHALSTLGPHIAQGASCTCTCICVYIYICLYVCMYTCKHIYIYVNIYIYIQICMYIHEQIMDKRYLSLYLFVCLSSYLSVYLSIYRYTLGPKVGTIYRVGA